MCEYDDSGNSQRFFIYGNYIDEVLFIYNFGPPVTYLWYVHDHLYSPVALIEYPGNVSERYEYDAYGNCYVLEPNFAPDPDGKSDYENPYLFTGRRVDILDSGSLKIQYNRNRYYDYYTGRWLTHDPLGHVDGMNLYEYANCNPTLSGDPYGYCSSGSYSLSDVKYSVKTGGFCPPFTAASAKSKIKKLLKKYKKKSFDTCPPGEECKCVGWTSSDSGPVSASYTKTFWWFPWGGPKPGLFGWFKCTVNASGSAILTYSLRINGKCCPK